MRRMPGSSSPDPKSKLRMSNLHNANGEHDNIIQVPGDELG